MSYKVQHLPPVYGTSDEFRAPANLPRAGAGGPAYDMIWAGREVATNARTSQYTALLREKAVLQKVGEETLDLAEAENRGLSQRERNESDAIDGRLVEINSLIGQIEQRRAETPYAGGFTLDGQGRWRPTSAPDGGRGLSAVGARFAQMFGTNMRHDKAGFSSLGEFLSGLHAGMWDQRYQALVTSNDGNGTGLQIPGEFMAELFDQSLEGEIVRPRARIEPMTSDTKTIAGLTAGSGGSPFGISGGWTAAGAEITERTPKTRAITLHAHKLAALVEVSNEAAADGTHLDRQLSEALQRGIGWLLDDAFIAAGTGAGQPLSLLNSSVTITVAKESGQPAATVYYENLVNMFSRLHPAHVGNSIWIANPTTIPQLLTLGHMVGVGGAPVPVLRDEGTGGFTILTRPVLFTEKAPALGTKGDIMLCDLSQYVVGLRAELIIEKSAHVGFTKDTTYYRAKLRADGMPLWDAAYTPDNGSTLSPFVTLATRA